MPNVSGRSVALGILWALGLPWAGVAGSAEPARAADSQRAWTAGDSVQVRYFIKNWGHPLEVGAPIAGQEPAIFSPDGKHFFVGAFHGDLANDLNVTDIYIYSTADVLAAIHSAGTRTPPRPLRTLSM